MFDSRVSNSFFWKALQTKNMELLYTHVTCSFSRRAVAHGRGVHVPRTWRRPVFLAVPSIQGSLVRHRKLRSKVYLWHNRSIMFITWHLTPILFKYPRKLSSEKHPITLRGLSCVRATCFARWSSMWCLGLILNSFHPLTSAMCVKCCQAIK